MDSEGSRTRVLVGQSARVSLLVLALAYSPEQVTGACYKQNHCGGCIAELFSGGTCLWYEAPGKEAYGTCLAGITGKSATPIGEYVQATQARAEWTMEMPNGDEAAFTVFDIDSMSESSCYESRCEYKGVCEPGFFAVENRPCYPDSTAYHEWRILKCCRQQRNADGYLGGFDSRYGVVQGSLFYASCCMPCFPGQVNVGCDAYRKGTCELCSTGSYNDVAEPGAVCKECEPCPAGKIRVGCGVSSSGKCVECPSNTFKLAGLEGSHTDVCEECGGCDRGALRQSCGLASPGFCETCPKGTWFSSPYCRNCLNNCGFDSHRYGCGDTADGVCSSAVAGMYEYIDSQGYVRWKACEDCPAGYARVGCGSFAPGECMRVMDAVVEENLGVRCPGVPASSEICPGARLVVRWTVDGYDGNAGSVPRAIVGTGNCTAADGLCLAGSWHAALYRRSLEAPAGAEVASIGTWWPSQLNAKQPEEGVQDAFSIVQLMQYELPAEVPGSTGYFVRMSFSDNGEACCTSDVEHKAWLIADTDDFDIRDPLVEADVALENGESDWVAGDREAATAWLEPMCEKYGDSVTSASPQWAIHRACELAAALRLGLHVGESEACGSPALLRSVLEPAVARADAIGAAQVGRAELAHWETLESEVHDVLPDDASAWADLVAAASEPEGSSNGGTNESVGTTTLSKSQNKALQRALETLVNMENVSLELEVAALRVESMWREEQEIALHYLGRTLGDLKKLDIIVEDESDASGFDLIRMVQTVTVNLWENLEMGPKTKSKGAWFRDAVQTIGNSALMLIGSWGNTWQHDVRWRIGAEVGEVSSFEAGDAVFGGAWWPATGPESIEGPRKRIWEPFKTAAEAWLQRWDEELARGTDGGRRTLADSEIGNASSANGSASGIANGSATSTAAAESGTTGERAAEEESLPSDVKKLVILLRKFLPFVEALTERLLEPFSRVGAELLRGPLPSVDGFYESGKRFLTDALAGFSESSAATDAWFGFGTRAMRPWIEPSSEVTRVSRAAAEVVTLIRGRAALLDETLLALLDVRMLLLEPIVNTNAAQHARSAAAQVGAVLAAPGGLGNPGAAWRWQEIHGSLLRALGLAHASTARLCRRRLISLERLAKWLGESAEAPAPDWRAPWKRRWRAGGTAKELKESEDGALNELDRALHDLATREPLEQGYLRVEFGDRLRPLAFESLRRFGHMALRLQAPPGYPIVRMHPEVHVAMTTPSVAWTPLNSVCKNTNIPCPTVDNPPNITEVGAYGEHVELHIEHAWGSSLASQQDTGFDDRHARRSCKPLEPLVGSTQEIIKAAVLPLDGIWFISLRDGLSGELLTIEEGATLRIMFRVNVPAGSHPWRWLDGLPDDVLYAMPESGDCSALDTNFGEHIVITTVPPAQVIEGPTTSTTTKHTTSKNVLVQAATTPEPVTTSMMSTSSTSAAQFLAPTESESGGLPTVPLLFWLIPTVVGVFLCSCCVGCFAYLRCQRRLLRAQVKAIKLDASDEEAGLTDDEHLQAGDEAMLEDMKPPPNVCISNAWCPAPWKEKPSNGQEDPEDWLTTDTPRKHEDGAEAASGVGSSRSHSSHMSDSSTGSSRTSISSSDDDSDSGDSRSNRSRSLGGAPGKQRSSRLPETPPPPLPVTSKPSPLLGLPLLPPVPQTALRETATVDKTAPSDIVGEQATFNDQESGQQKRTQGLPVVKMPKLPDLLTKISNGEDEAADAKSPPEKPPSPSPLATPSPPQGPLATLDSRPDGGSGPSMPPRPLPLPTPAQPSQPIATLEPGAQSGVAGLSDDSESDESDAASIMSVQEPSDRALDSKQKPPVDAETVIPRVSSARDGVDGILQPPAKANITGGPADFKANAEPSGCDDSMIADGVVASPSPAKADIPEGQADLKANREPSGSDDSMIADRAVASLSHAKADIPEGPSNLKANTAADAPGATSKHIIGLDDSDSDSDSLASPTCPALGAPAATTSVQPAAADKVPPAAVVG